MPGNRPHIYSIQNLTDVPETGANTETVGATVTGVCTEFNGQSVLLQGFLAYTAPAAITSLTIRVRADSLTGAIVGEAEVDTGDVVATKLGLHPFMFIDQPADIAGRSYVVTFQGAGEGGPGTCNTAVMSATVS